MGDSFKLLRLRAGELAFTFVGRCCLFRPISCPLLLIRLDKPHTEEVGSLAGFTVRQVISKLFVAVA